MNVSTSSAAVSTQDAHISLRHVTKSFRGGRDQILKGVNIDFPRGKLTYILGSSGAGKSVTLKHILGLIQPDSGTVEVAGRDLSKLSNRQLVEHRQLFGMLFQNSALFDDITVFENVAFPLREHTSLPETQIEEKVVAALKSLGMQGGYDKFPNELSGGMRKRVGLARAIIREPQILLYDEPTRGLAVGARHEIYLLMNDLAARGKAVVMASSDLPEVLGMADRILVMHDGRVTGEIANGPGVTQEQVMRLAVA